MRRIIASILLMIMLLSMIHVGASAAGNQINPFQDVRTDAYYYDAVLWAYQKDITTGTSNTTFSPNNQCTRGQTVTFLWRSAGSPIVFSDNPFSDVKNGDYYYNAVLWAVANNITKGVSSTEFKPNAVVTRSQFVTFLYRFARSPSINDSNPFKDVASSSYYYSAVIWAVENKVTNGISATSFGPDSPCTRGQTVTFLHRFFSQDLGNNDEVLTPEQVSKKVSPAVFYIETYSINGDWRGSGSGFFISSDGYAITNYHVIANAFDIIIVLTNGERYGDKKEQVKIIDVDETNDLALLKVDGGGFRFLEIGNSASIRQGQEVFAFGSPRGLENTMSKGIISNTNRSIQGTQYIQISVPIEHGSSGGALVDTSGKVIGITSAGLESTADLNLAIPSSKISTLNYDNKEDGVFLPAYNFFPDYETYGGFDYVLDFGYFSGVELIDISKGSGYYSLVYDLSDYHTFHDTADDSRFAASVFLYKEAIMNMGLYETTPTTDSNYTLGNSDEAIMFTPHFDSGTIEILLVRMPKYYSDLANVPDFGWYTRIELEERYLDGRSIVYLYDYSNYYKPADFEAVLFDYFDYLCDRGFYFRKQDGSNYLFEGYNWSIVFIDTGKKLVVDVAPLAYRK